MFGFNILGDILLTLFQNLIPTDQLGAVLTDASQYMLPKPEAFSGDGAYEKLWSWLALLGLVVGAGLFGFAVLAAGGLGDARRLVQAVGGLAVCTVAGPATLALYTILRDPMIDSAALVAGTATKTLVRDLVSAPSAEQGLLSAVCILVGVVGYTIAAGILGFGMILAIIAAPVAVAFTVFRAGMSIAVRWAVTFVGLLFAPLVAAIGLAITAGIVAGASWSPTSWVVAATGMLMAGAAPFVILSRLQALGLPDIAAGRGNGGAARGTAAAARAATMAAKAIK